LLNDQSLRSRGKVNFFYNWNGAKMKMTLREVNVDELQILINLYEKYAYEWSQYVPEDVNEFGLYCDERYDFDCFMQADRKCIAYFIEADDKLAGFALIHDMPEVTDEKIDYCLCDFFVMHKYRRLGIGRKAVFEIFDRQRGRWHLYYSPKNTASAYFWGKAIDEYMAGQYRLVKSHPQCIYSDGTLGDAVFFDNTEREKSHSA